jgi:hypothetical protein
MWHPQNLTTISKRAVHCTRPWLHAAEPCQPHPLCPDPTPAGDRARVSVIVEPAAPGLPRPSSSPSPAGGGGSPAGIARPHAGVPTLVEACSRAYLLPAPPAS